VEVIEVDDEGAAAATAADVIAHARPDVLGVATGSSPAGTYGRLVERRDLAPPTVLCLLDEYVGLPPDHPRRYRREILAALGAPLGLAVVAPDVDDPDPDAAAARYDATIARLGGVDLQVLGVGRNGHIGFNEPGTPFDAPSHVVELSDATRRDNARFFGSTQEVPARAITQGIGTILRARRIVLIATGPGKADAVRAAIDGPVTPDVPVTALRGHPSVTVVADRAALGGRRPAAPREVA